MSDPQPCMRCGKLEHLFSNDPAKLRWLCMPCIDLSTTSTPCPDFHHDYRGSQRPGTWICMKCPSTVESQKITSTPIDVTPTYDY